MTRILCTCLLLSSLILATTGCLALGFGTGDDEHINPSVGQELIDLKRALDKNCITSEEYEESKSLLLHKYKTQN